VERARAGTTLRERLQAALGGAYTLGREFGGGGMSHVFVAHDATLGRDVVVKVLPPDAAAALSAERFKRGIALAARLQHPHIVPVLGIDITGHTRRMLRDRPIAERDLAAAPPGTRPVTYAEVDIVQASCPLPAERPR
jgi:hypothetical protein